MQIKRTADEQVLFNKKQLQNNKGNTKFMIRISMGKPYTNKIPTNMIFEDVQIDNTGKCSVEYNNKIYYLDLFYYDILKHKNDIIYAPSLVC